MARGIVPTDSINTPLGYKMVIIFNGASSNLNHSTFFFCVSIGNDSHMFGADCMRVWPLVELCALQVLFSSQNEIFNNNCNSMAYFEEFILMCVADQ